MAVITTFPVETTSQIQIEAVLRVLPEFWNRHDVPGYAAHFSENVDFVNVFGGHARGRSALVADLKVIHQTIFRNSRLRIVKHDIRFVAPTVAIAIVDWHMTGHESTEAKAWDAVREGIFTAVLVAEEDTWRITAFQNTDKIPLPGPTK